MTLKAMEIEVDVYTYHISKKTFFLMCRLVVAGYHAKKKYGFHKQIIITMTLDPMEIEVDI